MYVMLFEFIRVLLFCCIFLFLNKHVLPKNTIAFFSSDKVRNCIFFWENFREIYNLLRFRALCIISKAMLLENVNEVW